MSVEEHLADIDFRSWEARHDNAIEDFKAWYDELYRRERTEVTQGQLTMLSSVLWYLMPKKDYKKFMRVKKSDKRIQML